MYLSTLLETIIFLSSSNILSGATSFNNSFLSIICFFVLSSILKLCFKANLMALNILNGSFTSPVPNESTRLIVLLLTLLTP